MKLASLLYHSVLHGGPLTKRLSRRLRRLLLKMADPECEMEVHGRNLAMPLSHQLPWHRRIHPCYDSLPERLADFLRDRDGALAAIDVGANIGDTIAAFQLEESDSILAIEPAPGFVRYLRKNWAGDERVTIVEAVCSSGGGDCRFSIEETDGTARVSKGIETGLPSQTLDQILENRAEFPNPNLLKIDTDGHDLDVISGSTAILQRSKPAVFFECDAFDNPKFLENCRDTLATFRDLGYAGMLVYDNFGYLIGRYALDQLDAFEQLLFYQITSEFFYCDLLLIHNASELAHFHDRERHFFAERAGKPEQHLPSGSNRSAGTDRKSAKENRVELAG